MNVLAARLKSLRMRRELERSDVAKALGIAYQTYVNYENGARMPKSDTLVAIADFYDVTVDFLIGKTESPEPRLRNGSSAADFPNGLRDEEIRLILLYRALGEPERRLLDRMLTGLLGGTESKRTPPDGDSAR